MWRVWSACIIAWVAVACPWASGQAAGRVLHVAQQPLADLRPTEQFRSIREVAGIVRAGDRVIIHGGIYRETIRVRANGRADAPIRFEAAPFEQVVISGADRVSGWERLTDASPVFAAQLPNPPAMLAAAIDHGGAVERGEQRLRVDGCWLRAVDRREDLAPGTFWVDDGERRVFVLADGAADLARSAVVERVARPVVWHAEGTHVHLRGLRFADVADDGDATAAVRIDGDHALIEDCVFEHGATGAIVTGDHAVLQRCRFMNNARLGLLAGEAHGLRLGDVTITGNGTIGGREAGGLRVVRTRDAVVDWSTITSNGGAGVTVGEASERCIVQDSLVRENRGGGVVVDAAVGVQVEGNVIVGNGLTDAPDRPGTRGGVVIDGAQEVVVRRNLILGNGEGIAYVDRPRQVRRLGSDVPQWVWPSGVEVRQNTVAHNRFAQVSGCFDTPDDRNWPARMQIAPAAEVTLTERGPAGLSLESMKLTHAQNVYAMSLGQRFAVWGATGRRQKVYPSLGQFRADLEMEAESLQTDLPFAGPHELDLRLPKNSPAMLLKAYPQGDVPGVRVGVVER